MRVVGWTRIESRSRSYCDEEMRVTRRVVEEKRRVSKRVVQDEVEECGEVEYL